MLGGGHIDGAAQRDVTWCSVAFDPDDTAPAKFGPPMSDPSLLWEVPYFHFWPENTSCPQSGASAATRLSVLETQSGREVLLSKIRRSCGGSIVKRFSPLTTTYRFSYRSACVLVTAASSPHQKSAGKGSRVTYVLDTCLRPKSVGSNR